MSFWRSFTNLSPGARAAFGGVVMVWGVAGLYFTEPVGDTLGIKASEEEKAKLERAIPRIQLVDRNQDEQNLDGYSDRRN